MTRPEALERARTMYGTGDNGWSIHGIRHYLERNGVNVSWWTVRRWVDPARAEQERASRRDAARIAQRRKRGTSAGAVRVFDGDVFEARCRELRGAGLSYEAVVKVIRLDHGVSVSARQLEYGLETGRLSGLLEMAREAA